MGRPLAQVARAVVLTGLGALAGLSALSFAACYDFTFDPATQASDASDARDARPAGDGGNASGCAAGTLTCGGDAVRGDPTILYRCAGDGGGALVAKCASGCMPADGGVAHCAIPVTPCEVGGYYCGGDKLDGDPGVLYRCGTGSVAIESERCKKGCQVAPPENDDRCVE